MKKSRLVMGLAALILSLNTPMALADSSKHRDWKDYKDQLKHERKTLKRQYKGRDRRDQGYGKSRWDRRYGKSRHDLRRHDGHRYDDDDHDSDWRRHRHGRHVHDPRRYSKHWGHDHDARHHDRYRDHSYDKRRHDHVRGEPRKIYRSGVLNEIVRDIERSDHRK